MSDIRTTPRVSIALATYNGAEFLPQLLESLDRQTLRPFEIIAFDDNSADETLTVLDQFRQRLPLTVHASKQAVGVVRNFRRAVANCSGDYIAFCDQDDVWLPEKLALLTEALRKIDGLWPAMVYSDLIVVDDQLNRLADSYWQHRKLKPARESFASLLYGNIVTGCTMLINRPMATEVARMPDDVLMHDFWIACVAYGLGRCTFVEEPTMLYRQHTSNVTTNDAVTWQTRWKRLTDFLLNGEQAAQFLHPQIEQAQNYAHMYAKQLSPDNQAALARLLKLKSQWPLIRKWRTFTIKFLHLYS